MDEISLTQVIAKLRRDQPRNALTMRVCDELEKRLKEAVLGGAEEMDRKVRSSLGEKFNRTAYQKEYMRRWRIRKKQSGT
jgi:hypothetical protein